MSESLVIKKPSLKYQEKTFDFNYNFFDDEGYLDLSGLDVTIKESKRRNFVKLKSKEKRLNPDYVYYYVIRENGVNFYITEDYRALVLVNGNLINVGFINNYKDYSIIYLDVEGGKYLVINRDRANLVSSDFSLIEEIALPINSSVQSFSRRLFIGYKNKILVTEVVNYSNLVSGINTSAEITISPEDGEIKKLIEVRDRLVVICENAVYSLTAGYNLEDLKIKRIDSSKFDLVENSIVKIGDEVYFSGSKNIYKVEKDRVDYYEIAPEYFTKKLDEYCGGYKQYYVIPLGENNLDKALFFDTVNKTYEVFSFKGKLGTSGEEIITRDGYLYSFYESVEEEGGEGEIINRTYKEYLETFKRKYFSEIKLDCIGFCTLVMETEETSRDLIVTEEKFGGRISVAGESIKFRILDKSNDFFVKKIWIKYRVFE